jgi:hypothetical protein
MGGSMHNEPKLPPHICLNHNKLNNKQFFMSRREPALLEKTMQSQLKFPDPEWTNSHLHTIRDDGWLVDMKHYSIVFKFPSWLLYLLLAQLVVCSVGLAPITWREMPSFLSRPWCRLQVHAGADAEGWKLKSMPLHLWQMCSTSLLPPPPCAQTPPLLSFIS